jgi:hypothetical protein
MHWEGCSETRVNLYRTAGRHIPEFGTLHSHCQKEPKSCQQWGFVGPTAVKKIISAPTRYLAPIPRSCSPQPNSRFDILIRFQENVDPNWRPSFNMKWGPGRGVFIERFADIQTDVVLSGLVNISPLTISQNPTNGPYPHIITASQIRFNIILQGISP